jgi:hypothetical protein
MANCAVSAYMCNDVSNLQQSIRIVVVLHLSLLTCTSQTWATIMPLHGLSTAYGVWRLHETAHESTCKPFTGMGWGWQAGIDTMHVEATCKRPLHHNACMAIIWVACSSCGLLWQRLCKTERHAAAWMHYCRSSGSGLPDHAASVCACYCAHGILPPFGGPTKHPKHCTNTTTTTG